MSSDHRVQGTGRRAQGTQDSGCRAQGSGRRVGPRTARSIRDLSTDDFIAEGARHLGIDVEDLASRTRRRDVVEARRLLLALGRERWSQQANQLGAGLGKTADTISYPAREGTKPRLEDEGFARRYEAPDQAMIGNPC